MDFILSLLGMREYIFYNIKKIKPEFLLINLEEDFKYNNLNRIFVIDEIIIPLAKEIKLPIALNYGNISKKRFKESLEGLESLENLCKTYINCKFIFNFSIKVDKEIIDLLEKNNKNLYIYKNNINLIETNIYEKLLIKNINYKNEIKEEIINKYIKLENLGWKNNIINIKNEINLKFNDSYYNFIKKN